MLDKNINEYIEMYTKINTFLDFLKKEEETRK